MFEWGHVRGKFSETLDENNTLASEALVYIGKLHQREQQTDEVLPDYDQRRNKPEKEACSVIRAFEKWPESINNYIFLKNIE